MLPPETAQPLCLEITKDDGIFKPGVGVREQFLGELSTQKADPDSSRYDISVPRGQNQVRNKPALFLNCLWRAFQFLLVLFLLLVPIILQAVQALVQCRL